MWTPPDNDRREPRGSNDAPITPALVLGAAFGVFVLGLLVGNAGGYGLGLIVGGYGVCQAVAAAVWALVQLGQSQNRRANTVVALVGLLVVPLAALIAYLGALGAGLE